MVANIQSLVITPNKLDIGLEKKQTELKYHKPKLLFDKDDDFNT